MNRPAAPIAADPSGDPQLVPVPADPVRSRAAFLFMCLILQDKPCVKRRYPDFRTTLNIIY
jgi:hypothetical protein